MFHPAISRRQLLIAIALPQSGHGLRVRLGEDGLGCTHSRRDTGNPLHVGIGKLLEVGCAIERAICHQRGQARGGLSLMDMGTNHLAEVLRITAIATERLHQQGDARLMCNDQRQHDLVEVRPVLPAVASVRWTTVSSGGSSLLERPIGMKARTVERRRRRTKAQTLGGSWRNEAGEFRHPRGIEGIQSPTEGLIIALCRGNARRINREVGVSWKHRGTRESA